MSILSSPLYRIAFYEACRLELKIALPQRLTSPQLEKCDRTAEMCRPFKVHKFYSVNISASRKPSGKEVQSLVGQSGPTCQRNAVTGPV